MCQAPHARGIDAACATHAHMHTPLEPKVADAVQATDLLRLAESRKRRAATEMNERSSRAHSLLLLDLEQTVRVRTRRGGGDVSGLADAAAAAAGGGGGSGDVTVRSQLCLADLGGSEQLKKSGATGETQREATEINLGLLALKKCIHALNAGWRHVPFSTSILTALLSRALGGDARTLVIVTAASDPMHIEESVQTLGEFKCVCVCVCVCVCGCGHARCW
jgi:hypothetical protein